MFFRLKSDYENNVVKLFNYLKFSWELMQNRCFKNKQNHLFQEGFVLHFFAFQNLSKIDILAIKLSKNEKCSLYYK